MKRIATGLTFSLCFLLWVGSGPAWAQRKSSYTEYSQPKLFSYGELKRLLQSEKLEGELSSRLEVLLNTPFVSNEAFYSGAKPRRPASYAPGTSSRGSVEDRAGSESQKDYLYR